ncbi:hypothetical protein CK203_060142 [Vitis vinifera]|uniref:Uncharacterized protein n=1 Tax=Vitis vinifera TaxID=29760 RepID=A0A438GMC9_VITVI|nr:hypothetical protein CK203_060142 [Vitis vinifera]
MTWQEVPNLRTSRGHPAVDKVNKVSQAATAYNPLPYHMRSFFPMICELSDFRSLHYLVEKAYKSRTPKAVRLLKSQGRRLLGVKPPEPP